MKWTDDAIVLGARPFGEGAVLAQVFARDHGRTAGLVHGSRRNAAALQAGTLVAATWSARLEDQLGTLKLETQSAPMAAILGDGAALLAVQSATILVLETFGERDAHPTLFDGLKILTAHLDDPTVWPALLVRWELGLLAELGFGLDLNSCALTGSFEDLAYVSPKTGRAASRAAGEPYKDKLLSLPAFLVEGQGMAPPSWADIASGLALSEHFLVTRVFAAHNKALPEPRKRLTDKIARLAKAGQSA